MSTNFEQIWELVDLVYINYIIKNDEFKMSSYSFSQKKLKLLG